MEDKRRPYFLVALFALSLRCVSGGCEEHALGLADGYILDSQLTASSVLNSNTPAKNGRLNYTAGSSWCASTSDSNPYLQINLQALYIICAVSTQGNSQTDQWVKTYTLQSSRDGTNWTDYEEGGLKKVFRGNFDAKSTTKTALFSELSARYLRVVARDNHGGVCMRIELYGEQQIQGNIALFMPSSQSTTEGSSIASWAVDGVKNSLPNYCTSTQSAGTTNPWWRVDLGQVRPVAEVRILNRGDCCADRLNGAQIRVGNNAANGSNHLCATITRIPQGTQNYFHCNPAAQGRYVYIRIPGGSKILTVCEVEVYSFLTDLALNQPADQISINAGGVASRAVDGGTSTDYTQGSCTHTTTTNSPWWRVDLGSSVAVAEVCIVNRACIDPCGSRLSSFEIRIGNISENNGGISNSRCGNLHSLNSGERKSIYCVPRIVGRYVYIRIPGANKVLSLCEVEVYSRRRVDGNACNNQPVGLEDSSKIPDYRFTASSNGVNTSPSSGRLKGSVSWVPSTTNADDFLQIDLGSVYAVCSVATQGSPNANEWITTYKIKTSLDNSNWTTYAENNADKVFDGNNDGISIIRNDLLHATLAKFIRFYPMAFNAHKALRVEVYGSPEGCQSPLGLEDRRIQHSQISASSKVNSNHAANFSRLYSSSSWCSSVASSSEYLQVDLGETTAITGIATQGDSSVDKWVTRYMVQFGANSYTRLFRYLSFQGNHNRNLPYVNWFSEPVETSVVRIVPLSWKTSVCLRLELYGCGLLLKVPKPTINNFQDVNLQPAKGSFVNLQCNASSGVEGMTVVFRWAKDANDISTLSSAISTQGKFFLSTLRVNFTKAEDIVSSYHCTKESEASRTVYCQKTFVCLAFYSSLALRLEPTYQTAVVTVKLRVPDAVKQITVDSILGASAVIRWQKLPAGGADEVGIAGYQLWYVNESNPNSANFVNATKNDTLVLDNLTRNTRYMVKVRAISALGFGLWSSTVNFRTARTVTCEEKILGPETGLTPDMVMSSSQYNSSTSSSHSVMSYAVDFPWCASLNDTSPYLEIDLGDVFVICALSTRGGPHGEHWVKWYTLEASLDGTTWTDYKEEDQQRTFLGNYDSATVVKEELYSGMVCQKVRLRVKTYHGLPCLKLQLFGVKQSRGNLALNQPADQIDTNAGGVASRAVDGGTSTDYTQGSCTHTTTTTDPWWRVDLGSSVPVTEVRIVNRACSGGCGSRLSAFEIRIGNSTSGGGSSNQLCRNNLQVPSGQTMSFYCDPSLYGRYVYIRIPGNSKVLTLCEVEVYSAVCDTQPVGTEDSFKIPDYRFSASSFKAGNEPYKGRLNGGSAWISSTNSNNSDFLEVDLGSVYFVCGVVTQGNPTADEWTTEFKLKTSLNNKNWTTYRENGVDKMFAGNTDRSSLRRNSLIRAPLAKFIRFYPVTYSASKALRVEIYGYPQGSKTPLGLENGDLTDLQLTASSNLAAVKNGRLYNQSAWCSSTASPTEYFQVDLGNVKTITGVATQGDPSSDKWVKTYTVSYSYTGQHWTQYKGLSQEPELFKGNDNRNGVQANWIKQPFVARYLRIFAQTWNSGICLRIDGYGSAFVNTPIISPPLVDKTLNKTVGYSVILSCVVYGRAHVSVTWMVNGQEPTNSSDITTDIVLGNNWEKTESNLTITYRNASYEKSLFQCTRVSRETGILRCKKLSVTCNANYFGTLLGSTSAASVSLVDNLLFPEFTITPKDATVMEERSVVLHCSATGIPTPVISWSFKSKACLPSTSSQLSNGSLLVTDVQNNINYEGTYICNASSIAGVSTAEANLTVWAHPKITHASTRSVTILVGDPLTLTCVAIGDPKPVISWKKIDVQKISRAVYDRGNSTLSIHQVSIVDEGVYQCTARSAAGVVATNFTVEVQVKPTLYASGNKTLILEKDQRDVIVKCFGNGYPAPTVRWRKCLNAIPVVLKQENDSVVQVVSTDIQNPMDNVTSDLYLRIVGVTYNESGNYTCTVDNGVGDNPAASSVEVIFKPEFAIKPQSKIVEEGATVSFMCKASGVPQPEVSWSPKNGSLPPHFTDLNGNLTIPSVGNNNTYEGTYTCTATSRAGVATIDVVLTVHVPPRIVLALNKSVVAERGDTVRLSCSAVGDPTPRYQWTKDGSPVIPNAVLENNNKTLQLTDVESRNDGIYTCLAANDAGDVSTSSNVTVHARPSILDIFSKTVVTIEHRVLNLSCTGESIPAADVTWYKHNKPVTSGQHILITTTGKFIRITTLSIQRVKYEDRGDYTCSFANYRGSVTRTGSLIVLVPSNISIPPTSVNEKLGLRVSFNCTVRGFPLPTLLWTKDNINLNISNGIEIAQHEDSSKIESFTSLTIIQAKRSDTGVYVCHANNSAGTTSKAANLTVLEKPDKLTTTIDSTTAHTVKLSWTVSFDGNSPVLFYTAAHNISNGTMYYNVSSNESSLVMNLNPATFYEFTITATNQFGTSDPVVISTTTLESVPDAPRFVRAIATASRSISLDWTIPAVTNGKLINYVVYYDTTEDYGDNATVPMNQTLLPNTTSLVIESLVPFTYYTFQVQAFTKVGGGHRSDPTERVRTHEDVPGTPSDITVEKQGEEGFVIRWKKPSEANGIITGYKLYFVVRRNNADDTATVEDRVYVIKDDSTTKLIRVYELNGDKTYDVTVQARTSKGYGQKSTETRTVKTRPIRPPPPPPPQPPNETTTETAVIELAEFSDINGPIVYYQVINLRVPQAEQDNFPTPEEITPNKLVSYEEAHTSNKPVAYVAFGFEGNEFNRHKRFKLGNGQTCCPRKKRDIAKTYYNGPLEPNTIYKAFTRAFTSESEYSQSQYIPIRTKELATPPTPSPPGSVTGIIVGVIVGVLLIVFAAIVFIYIRRKRRTRDDHADENELQSLDRVSERAGRQSFDNEGFKSDIDGNRRPIPVQNLKDYYFRMHEDDNRLFTEEYKSLKITGSPTTQICDRPDNKVRNRYGNIKAYDHSRVILTMGGSSDYINANYIDGYVRPKQYIATIGPKPETVNHFWWMIWQEKTSIIVMLTRPVEQGKVKCHQYWPDSGGEEYGALTVTVKEKLEYSEFEIRTLSLQMPTKPDLEPRIVKHFYFTAWPDHDVPDEATGLLQFWKAVKKCASGIEEPIVVHCSAGVGRTGTFITIDAMMEQISASEELDVYSFVTRMREQRNFMVQRQSQYNFIFYALLEATTFGDTEILSHNLRMKMQKMTTKNPKTGKTSFEREFELLDGVVPQENSDFKSALKSVNTTKNRYANVLPYEKSRVVLPKTSEEEDDTSYINASYIEGYQQKKAYIATQAPLRNTVGDFWRMVWDEEVCCIVMLVTLKEDSEVPFVDYWSEVEATMHGSLSIETTDFDNKENYAVRKINLSDTKTEKVRKVTQYTVSNWPKDGIPSDPMAVVNMIGVVQKIQQQTGNNPIVVHCSDGIGRTGTFCAIVTSLEHIKLEDSVDVFTTVRMLRTQRPGMVQTLEQYKFIYDALMAYLDSFEASLYQNFL